MYNSQMECKVSIGGAHKLFIYAMTSNQLLRRIRLPNEEVKRPQDFTVKLPSAPPPLTCNLVEVE